jgi:acyl dehydratase
MQVIEALATHQGGMSLTEISSQLKVPMTSLFSLLRSLEDAGFVLSESGHHKLGPEAYRLATLIQRNNQFPANVHSLLKQLQEECGETSVIGVPTDDRMGLVYADVVEGIGDDNPLWTDHEYAARTYLREPVAPPSWVLCCFSGAQFGWPGLGGFHSRSRFHFHKMVRKGDRVTPRMIYKGFEGPKPSKFAGRAVTDEFLIDYHNQHGHLLCEMEMFVLRYERGEGRRRAGGRKVELPHPWTKPELDALEQEILAEKPRGSAVRYWDDVNPGDEMEGLIKGPIGLTDEIAFVATGAAPVPRLAAHGVALRRYQKHPKWAFRDPETKALEPIYAVHYNKHAAQAMGVPVAYDVGVQRSCWHIHMLTNWMGDDGWLQEIEHDYRGFVYLSDVVRFGGRVAEKTCDDAGNYCVRLETWAVKLLYRQSSSARSFWNRSSGLLPGASYTLMVPPADRTCGKCRHASIAWAS